MSVHLSAMQVRKACSELIDISSGVSFGQSAEEDGEAIAEARRFLEGQSNLSGSAEELANRSHLPLGAIIKALQQMHPS